MDENITPSANQQFTDKILHEKEYPFSVDEAMASSKGGILLISARSEMDMADVYSNHLRRDILSDIKDISIEIFECKTYETLGEAFSRNLYAFLLLTETFCKEDWPAFSMEQCVKDSLYNQGRICTLIPVLMKSDTECHLPMGLNSLTSLKFYHFDDIYKKRVRKMLLRDVKPSGFK